MFRKFLIFALFWAFCVPFVYGQNGLSFGKNQFRSGSTSQIGHNWQIGIGGDIVRFSDKDATYIGDKHLIQVPRFNATKRINNSLSIDGAISFGAFDSLVITNQVPYFSFDVSARYRYIYFDRLDPYVFIGGGIVDSHPLRKTTPTINIGTGVTYWFLEHVGVNTQFYYKHSLESFESMRSHIQVTFSVIFGLNLGRSVNRGSSSCYYNQNKRSRKRGSTSCHYNQHKRRR